MDNLKIEFIDKKKQHSEYDWANLSFNDNRVGKVRCLIKKDTLIIYSINVFPEFEGHGYAKTFVNEAKKTYKILIANRVRFTAKGFWEKVGFSPYDADNWIYKSE